MATKQITAADTGIGKPIVIGFFVILLSMIALIAIGLNFMYQANQRLHQIVEHQNVKTHLANTIQTALSRRALSMHVVTVTKDDFEKDAERMRFDEHGAAYVRARDAIEKMQLSAQEKEILDAMRQLTKIARPELEAVMNMSFSGHQQDVMDLLRTDAMPKQRRIGEQAEAFIQLQQTQSRIALRNAEASYARAKILMLLLGFCTIALGLGITRIVSRRVSNQGRQLAVQANFDVLTNLPNRLMLLDSLTQKIASVGTNKSGFAVMLLDLDRFKEVNDTLGHECGDVLLKEVGRRLMETVRHDDIVARLGGDEYVVVLDGLSRQEVTQIAEKLIAALEQPFHIEQQSIDISASFGITIYPEHGQSPSALLREADIAMYVAKRSGGGYIVYSPEQEKLSRDDLSLKSELREAIHNDQLVLYYQPKINHHQHRIIGLEALVRWVHPQRGFMPPDAFIPLAEQAGLIGALTRWVLKAALRQLADLHARGHCISMAVNLSASNLHDPDMVDTIIDLMRETHVPPKFLVLEITEGAVMASPSVGISNLHRLNKAGISLAIDDFGTGYSSLAYLKQLPVNELKIDKSFVLNMCNDDNDAVIVRSTIDLAHNLGLKVTAEGVENQDTWEILSVLGCDTSQGYFMSKPQAADRLDQWLKDSPWAVGSNSAFPDAQFWARVKSA